MSNRRSSEKRSPGALAKKATVIFVIYMVLIMAYIRYNGRGAGAKPSSGPVARTAVVVLADPAAIIDAIAIVPASGANTGESFRKGWIDMQDGRYLSALESLRVSYSVAKEARAKGAFVDCWNRFLDALDADLLQIRADASAQRNDTVISRSDLFVSTVRGFMGKAWLTSEPQDSEAMDMAMQEAAAFGDLARARTALDAQNPQGCANYLKACEDKVAKLPQQRYLVLQPYVDRMKSRIEPR